MERREQGFKRAMPRSVNRRPMLATDLVRARDILESVRREGGSDKDDDRYLGQMDLPARSLRVKDRRFIAQQTAGYS
jgi:hypothetical protein